MSADKHPPSQDWFHNRFIGREQHDAEIERLTAALVAEREKRERAEAEAVALFRAYALGVKGSKTVANGDTETFREHLCAALSRTPPPEDE